MVIGLCLAHVAKEEVEDNTDVRGCTQLLLKDFTKDFIMGQKQVRVHLKNVTFLVCIPFILVYMIVEYLLLS